MALGIYQHNFKLFLEGVKIEDWESASMSTVMSGGSMASIRIPDDGTLYSSFVPGVRVHFFMRRQPYMPNFQDEEDYVLLYEGECQNISRSTDSSGGRRIILSCHGWNYYSRQAKYYFFHNVKKEEEGGRQILDSSVAKVVAENKVELRASSGGGLQTETSTDRQDPNSNSFRKKIFLTLTKNGKSESRFSRHRDGRPSGISEIEDLLETFFYYFAYLGQGGLSGSGEDQKIYRNIFESIQLRKKVFTVSDGEVGKIDSSSAMTIFKEAAKGDNWGQLALENLFHSIGHHGNFFDLVSFLLMETAYTFVENLAPPPTSFSGESGINLVSFKPDIFFAMPPRCNILFPHDLVNTSSSRDFSIEPSFGGFLLPRSKVYAERFGIDENYSGSLSPQANASDVLFSISLDPSEQRIRVVSNPSSDGNRFEKLRGITPFFEDYSPIMGVFNYLPEDVDSFFNGRTEISNGLKIFKSKLERSLAEEIFASRTFNAQINFSPFLLAGHSCLIIDDDYNINGTIVQLNHDITPSSARSSIVLGRVRTSAFDEASTPNDGDSPRVSFDFYNRKYKGLELGNTYRNYYGTDLPEHGGNSITEGMKPEEIYKKIREVGKGYKKEYDSIPDNSKTGFADSVRFRQFSGETYYFRSVLGANPAISVDGQAIAYESDSIDNMSDDNPFPFVSERQNPILQYVKNLSERGKLKKGRT